MAESTFKINNPTQQPKPHNSVFSIFIFIFMFSSTITLYSYTHNLSIYTDYNDRNFIFLIFNGILVFLFMNSTRVSSLKESYSVSASEIKHQTLFTSSPIQPKKNQSVITCEIKHQNLPIASSIERKEDQSVITCETKHHTLPISSAIEQQEEEIEQDSDVLWIVEDKFVETEEVKDDDEETEEFNKKCAEFIRKVKETMKSESLHGLS
ncbi:hypothetical protein QVD17_27286 [Tagetes erecta]|uniref:Transmembrane protein n=1 Tax=Tagetes erecta TaxID=13708 RepID=A0AAD8K8F3_TARER|nr:hypothetical protein QVD17_27286 [Tagetes erecta]